MGRDSKFMISCLEVDESHAGEVFSSLKQWLTATDGPHEDDDKGGWASLHRLSDLLAPGQDRGIWAFFGSVWVGVGRNLYYPGLLRMMSRLPWEDPSSVQVFINDQDDEAWRLWILRNGFFEEVPQAGTRVVPVFDGSDISRLELISSAD